MRNRQRHPFQSGITLTSSAYTDLSDLIRLRYVAREIDALAATRARNPLSGLLTSNFRGRGIDFAEVRAYQQGDDIRSIDWRVTARTNQPHTKLFQEEREKPVLILVDQSAAMFFGSRVAFKSVVAAEAAALLAWASLDRGDRTGGIVFSGERHREVRPRRSKHSVLRLLNEINDFNHALSRESSTQTEGRYLANALRDVRRVARNGSSIFLLSDFAGLDEESITHLNQLSRHNQVVGFHISDQLERHLPVPDIYTITNGEQRLRINTARPQDRQAFEQAFAQRLSHVHDTFARMKAPLIELQTHEPVASSVVNRYNAFLAQAS